jgi:hypothetical protein
LCIHAIGVSKGVTLLEFEEALPKEDQEQSGEPEEPASEGSIVDELPECPVHRPSSFLKGKPGCILTQIFVCVCVCVIYIYIEYFYLFTTLSCRSWVKTFVTLYLSLSRYRT